MYQRILLTDDGSPLARRAVPHAIAIATAMRAEVVVMRVSRSDGAPPESLTRDSWAHLLAQGGLDHGEADPPLSEATTSLVQAGVAAAGALLLRSDDAGASIVEAAQRLGCDLIVMSTHGLSGVRRSVLGSVSESVVEHSEIPVLVCH